MKKLFLFILLILMINNLKMDAQSSNLSSIVQQSAKGMDVQVKIENGLLEGNYDVKSGVQSYLGIPFAQPPIGNLRWKEPQALGPWKGVKLAKQFGPRPVQKFLWDDMIFRSNGVSEDCLYLNVWTPKKRNTKDLPVLVYFYGGGNVGGDGSEYRYDGEAMAKKGIVVVTCNYRLNVFGNFAHPELSAEAPYKASGNYGYLDQLAALKWVKKNIASFGGNPNKVTIAGESAGSISVSYHTASPLSKGLIAGAIGESGAGIHPTMAPVTLKEAENIGVEFTTKAGYKKLAELRALSTVELYEIYNESGRFGFPVVLDGYFIPKYLKDAYPSGQHSDVPLLVGWNSAEIPGQAFMQGKAFTKDNFIAQMKSEFPNLSEELLKVYPHNDEKEVEQSATDLASDRFISYATWKWSDLHKQYSSKPVYRYLYSKLRPEPVTRPISSSAIPQPTSKSIGAPHACEIEYAMANLHLIKDWQWTADDYKVSEVMSEYFANFIKNGNPNGENLPNWKPILKNNLEPEVMIIDKISKGIRSSVEQRYKMIDRNYNNN
jgi:para-nitrobenzyl esterase